MDLQHLRASDGTGEAVLAHVQSVRNPGSTVLDLDNVDNWNSKCVVVTGTPATNGFISPTGMTVMYGHITAGDFIIDGYAPGYTDNGNTTAEVAFIKMTTNWADALVNILEVSLENDGLLKSTALDHLFKESELVFDHIASGCVLTGTGYGSTLAWSLTAGVVYINGRRYTVPAATGVVIATKDTYFDVLAPASGTVATLVYTGGNSVANNAASPALAANSIRIGIIVSGANIANVAAVNQGQIDKLLPISGGIAYSVSDSLGNPIASRDPNRRILSLRRIIVTAATTSVTPIQIAGLSCTVTIPLGRKAKVSLTGDSIENSVAGNYAQVSLWDGVVNSGTQLMRQITRAGMNAMTSPFNMQAYVEGTGTSKTFNAGLNILSGGQASMNAQSTFPASLTVELE